MTNKLTSEELKIEKDILAGKYRLAKNQKQLKQEMIAAAKRQLELRKLHVVNKVTSLKQKVA